MRVSLVEPGRAAMEKLFKQTINTKHTGQVGHIDRLQKLCTVLLGQKHKVYRIQFYRNIEKTAYDLLF